MFQPSCRFRSRIALTPLVGLLFVLLIKWDPIGKDVEVAPQGYRARQNEPDKRSRTLGVMAESLPMAAGGRWRLGARFVFRTGRRALVESLYLLTAPVIALVGLLLVLGGLCVAAVGLLWPHKPRPAVGALAPARWFADLERRRGR